MRYFDSEENVDAYIAMAEGYDGAELIALLRRYLPEGSSVLELGMGPGKDLDLLRPSYRVTGSDTSRAFLVLFHTHPSGDPAPSAEDLCFTRRMANAGEIVGIRLLDHLILGTARRWLSLKDRGAW